MHTSCTQIPLNSVASQRNMIMHTLPQQPSPHLLRNKVVDLGSDETVEVGSSAYGVGTHVIKVEPVPHLQFWQREVTDFV